LTTASARRSKSLWRIRAISLARALAVLIAFPAFVSAAEIKVLSAGALTQPLRELIPQYEQRTGDKVTVVYGNAGVIRGLLEKGEPADIVAVPSDAMTEAESRGWVQAGTRTDLAAVGIGVAVKRGATPPDISTPDALKRALLAASAVAYSDPTRATSGKHFDSVVLPALGIADQVRAKAKLQTEGSAAEFVRRGEADIAVQQVSELLPVEGVTVVGLLPGALQKVTVYTAAVAAKASSKDAAQKLLAFLATPASRAVFKSKGMDAPV
jgi:molybdate transport system substrate-binding protein